MTVDEKDRARGRGQGGAGNGARGAAGGPAGPVASRAPRRARAAVVAVAALALAASLAGCGSSDDFMGDKAPSSDDAIQVVPRDGAHGVRLGERFEVRVPDGRLERVDVRRSGDSGQEPVAGRISQDGMSWRPAAGPLEFGAKYTVDAVALDGSGSRSARHTTFTTLVPSERFIGFFTPESNATVGTGMIVSLEFNRPIADRAAVERGISVTADPGVEIAPHWFGRRRLDFRPRERWKPGTHIAVDLRLRDVKAGPRSYGTQRKTVHYRVGRDQVSTIDAAAHTMTVVREGKVLATLPVTAGNAGNPTYNGKMVILERHSVTRMNGSTVGFTNKAGKGEYDIPDVPHAMRLTGTGTFLHGNYWAQPEIFGATNTSHGCVGLEDVKGGRNPHTPASWLFHQSIVGDTVEVRNSPERVVAADNGLGGWNMTWQAWKNGSALK
ncbi:MULTISPECIES: Ig-like domain-containing protein [unclassified Streptomyces]|uniref:L,D-transpeptidase n=1 Tax=unclassified Streptomyces TaxID=2593676 RepID=UPI00382FE373